MGGGKCDRLFTFVKLFIIFKLLIMNKNLLHCVILLTVSLFTVGCSDNQEDEPDMPVGSEWIDPVFARVLQERGYISDAVTVTPADVENLETINISGYSNYNHQGNIKSLRGIEYFVNLVDLDCGYNQLTTLDVSGNTQLRYLYFVSNQLTTVDVSGNTRLISLNCYGNQLTKLDISSNTQLMNLHCGNNQLTALDLSGNTQLVVLYCDRNQLKTLDVSGNTLLTFLDCDENKLKTLNITNNRQLNVLRFGYNPGLNGVFEVTAWFDDSSIPSNDFTKGSWNYKDRKSVV